MAGRPPKPTSLRVLNGNAGHRPINTAEPKPSALSGVPPAGLAAEVAAQWARLAPRLLKFGLLTELDEDAFVTLCTLEAAFRGILASESISTEAVIELSKERRQLWARFGMTPSDRVKVKVEKPAPETKLSRFTSGA